MKTTVGKSTVQKLTRDSARHESGGAVLDDRREGSEAIESFLPEIETSLPVVAQRQTIQSAFGPVIQRIVDVGAVEDWLETKTLQDKFKLEGQDLEDTGAAYGRDVFDTLLYLDLLKARYRDSIWDLKGKKYTFSRAVTDLINQQPVITRASMLQAFAAVEESFNLKPETRETYSPVSHELAASREGAYFYDKDHKAFAKWITGKLDAPLGLDTYINCWEAILAVIIDTHPKLHNELQDVIKAYEMVAQLGGTDAEPDIIQAVEKLLRSRQRAEIKYGDKPPLPAIQRGDVLTYNRKNEPLYHVVIAISDAEDYREANVMSMWKQRAQTFAKLKFGFLMRLEKPDDELIISDFSK